MDHTETYPHETFCSTKRRSFGASMRDTEFVEHSGERLKETEHGRCRDDFGDGQVCKEVNLGA